MKRARKAWMLALVIGLLAVVLVAGCGTSNSGGSQSEQQATGATPTEKAPPAKAAKTWTLKITHKDPATSNKHKMAEDFARLAKEKTNGQIDIKVYPAGQLANTADEAIEAVRIGSIDMDIDGLDFLQKYVKDFVVFVTPYLAKDPVWGVKVTQSPPAQKIYEELRQKTGIRVLSASYTRPARYIWVDKPVKTVDELKGVKIRVANLPQYMEIYKAMGMQAVPVDYSETYTALSQGMVSAVELSAFNVVPMKFYEVAKNMLTISPLKITPMMIAINDKTFQGMPENIQKALVEAADEAGLAATKMEMEQHAAMVQEVVNKNGVKVIELDEAPVREMVKDVPKKLEQMGLISPGLYDELRKYGGL